MNKQPDVDSLIHQGRAGSYYGSAVQSPRAARFRGIRFLVNVVCSGDTKYTTVTDPKGTFLHFAEAG